MNIGNPSPGRKNIRRLIIFGLVALVLIAGAWGGWEMVLKDRLATKRWGVVEQGCIYRCGRLPLDRVRAILINHNIRVLVDLTENNPTNRFQIRERAAALKTGIEYHNFPLIGDGTGDLANYADAIAIICRSRAEGKPVLVHCAAGAQRTGGVVAAYRILVEGRAPEMVRAELRQYGWKPGKDQVLIDYLNRNMAALAEQLNRRKVIPAIPMPIPVL